MTQTYPVRDANSDKSVYQFNEFLSDVNFSSNSINNTQITYHDGSPLSQHDLNKINSLLTPFLDKIVIYYPISRYDEFPPIPVPYYVPSGFSPILLLGAITTFYKQPLGENNLIAYSVVDELYAELLNDFKAGKTITMGDVLFGLEFIESLDPTEGGYLLSLGSI